MADVRPFAATTWQGNAALVVGPYRVFEVLGSGGNGLVYRAVHATDQHEVALKILSPTIAADSTWRARFIREARQLAKLSDPHIVGCYDLGEQDGTLYMALELVRGGDSEALVRLHGGALPGQVAATLARDAARGLHAVHEARLIHRDVKPSNILLTEEQRAKLGDFGLVQVLDQHRPLTLGNKIVGTPAYMSPEQVEGDGELDFRSDLYSLGSTLYYLLTGKAPFHGPSPWSILNQVMASALPDPRRIAGGIDDHVASVVLKAGAHRRDDRYQSAQAMAEDLDRFLTGEPPHHAPIVALGGTPRIARTSERMPRIALARPPAVGTDPLAQALIECHFLVEELHDAGSLLAYISNDPPELLVIDLSDPAWLGAETLRAVRRRLEHTSLPILALTLTHEGDIESAWRAGASQVLVAAYMGSADFVREVRRTIGMDAGELQTMPITRRFSPQDSRRRECIERLGAACAQACARLEQKPADPMEMTSYLEELSGGLRAAEMPAEELDPGAHALILATQALLRELSEMPHHATPAVLKTVVRGIGAAAGLGSAENPLSLAGRSALVVDDDAVSRLMMTNALRVVGVIADSTSDASGALAAAERRHYDLVLSDVMMEGLNGFQLVGRLRQLAGYEQVPVVFVTSLGDFDQFFRTVPGGACDLIAKPFLLTELGLKALIHLATLPQPNSVAQSPAR